MILALEIPSSPYHIYITVLMPATSDSERTLPSPPTILTTWAYVIPVFIWSNSAFVIVAGLLAAALVDETADSAADDTAFDEAEELAAFDEAKLLDVAMLLDTAADGATDDALVGVLPFPFIAATTMIITIKTPSTISPPLRHPPFFFCGAEGF